MSAEPLGGNVFAIVGTILIAISIFYFVFKKKIGATPYAAKGAVIFFILGAFLIVKQFLGPGPW